MSHWEPGQSGSVLTSHLTCSHCVSFSSCPWSLPPLSSWAGLSLAVRASSAQHKAQSSSSLGSTFSVPPSARPAWKAHPEERRQQGIRREAVWLLWYPAFRISAIALQWDGLSARNRSTAAEFCRGTSIRSMGHRTPDGFLLQSVCAQIQFNEIIHSSLCFIYGPWR